MVPKQPNNTRGNGVHIAAYNKSQPIVMDGFQCQLTNKGICGATIDPIRPTIEQTPINE
jgi:hypothetical protein